MGFRKNEAEIYAALVNNGPSTVLEIAKATKMHRSNIYDSLRTLVERGLIFTDLTPAKLYSARDPKSLIDYFKRKELELDELLKNYELHSTKKDAPYVVRISEGTMALREAVNAMLTAEKPIDLWGIPGQASEVIGPMLKEWHKTRIKKKIHMRHIYNVSAADRVRWLNKMPYTEARILPPKYDSKITTGVYGDQVTIFLWDKNISVIEMNNSDIAQTYTNYFNVLWTKAKELK